MNDRFRKGVNLHLCFLASDQFFKLCQAIPGEETRKAVLAHGIGDALAKDSNGNLFYDFESGILAPIPVQQAMANCSNPNNFDAIVSIGEAYAEWANNLLEALDSPVSLENELEEAIALLELNDWEL